MWINKGPPNVSMLVRDDIDHGSLAVAVLASCTEPETLTEIGLQSSQKLAIVLVQSNQNITFQATSAR